METVGVFTMTLRLIRRLLPFLLEILEKLTALSGGLIGQIIALFLIYKLAPVLANVIDWGINIFMKLLVKFEG